MRNDSTPVLQPRDESRDHSSAFADAPLFDRVLGCHPMPADRSCVALRRVLGAFQRPVRPMRDMSNALDICAPAPAFTLPHTETTANDARVVDEHVSFLVVRENESERPLEFFRGS